MYLCICICVCICGDPCECERNMWHNDHFIVNGQDSAGVHSNFPGVSWSVLHESLWCTSRRPQGPVLFNKNVCIWVLSPSPQEHHRLAEEFKCEIPSLQNHLTHDGPLNNSWMGALYSLKNLKLGWAKSWVVWDACSFVPKSIHPTDGQSIQKNSISSWPQTALRSDDNPGGHSGILQRPQWKTHWHEPSSAYGWISSCTECTVRVNIVESLSINM